MGEWVNQLKWTGIAYTAVAVAALLKLFGLYLGVPALRRRWFPLPRLRPGTWTGHDVFLSFCIVFGFKVLVIALLLEMGFFAPLLGPTPAEDAPEVERTLFSLRCSHISSPLTLTVILGILLAVLFARSGARPHHYGLSWARWPANLGLGLAAFVLAQPVVMGIFAIALMAFPPDKPNPLEAFGKLPPPAWEWALFAFQMTVMAPLVEEILFRGILMGWLRRASLVGQVTLPFMTVAFVAMDFVKYDKVSETYSYEVAPTLFAFLLAAIYGCWLYRLKHRFDLNDAETRSWQPLPSESMPYDALEMTDEQKVEHRRQARETDEKRLQSWKEANANLAIFGSAMLFGVVHPDWPAPLALMPMGLVLGWLARRTQSLIGPITFHALFNLAAFITLYGSVLAPPNGNAQTTPARPSVAGSMTTSVPASQLPLRK